MADKTIGELPVATQLDDESLLVVEQQSQARSIKGLLIKKFARESAEGHVEEAKRAAEAAAAAKTGAEAAKSGAEAAQAAAEAAKAGAEAAKDGAETAKTGAETAASNAQTSATAAANSAQDSEDSALLSQSWAVGGTGSRPNEDSNNSRYWAGVAQAEADRATTPAAVGVYNYILQDRVTGDKYALLVENGTLALLGVSNNLDAKDLQLIDTATGVSYELITESGELKLLEVK